MTPPDIDPAEVRRVVHSPLQFFEQIRDTETFVLSCGWNKENRAVWTASRRDRKSGRSIGIVYGAHSAAEAVEKLFGRADVAVSKEGQP